MNIYKLVLLGQVSVGKTTLATYLSKDKYDEEHSSTIGIHFVPFKHEGYAFNLWDTSGQEKYNTFTNMYYRDLSVILLVYDVNNDFEHFLEFYLNEIKLKANSDTCYKIIMIGNKIDVNENLNFEDIDARINKVVDTCDMTSYIAKHIKISCKNKIGRDELLQTLCSVCSDIKKARVFKENNFVPIDHVAMSNKDDSSCGC